MAPREGYEPIFCAAEKMKTNSLNQVKFVGSMVLSQEIDVILSYRSPSGRAESNPTWSVAECGAGNDR